MGWKPVDKVFLVASTEEARKLAGRRIRVATEFTMTDTSGQPFVLKPGMEGFVGSVPDEAKDQIGIAIAGDGKRPNSNNPAFMTRAKIVRCNFGTFRKRFEIED